MGKKDITICDYCGRDMEELERDRMKDILNHSMIVTLEEDSQEGITLRFKYIEHGNVVELHHWVESLDACNTIHMSLAIKQIGEGLVKDYKKQLAAGLGDIPCVVKWSDDERKYHNRPEGV